MAIEDDRTGISIEIFKRAIAENLYYIQGKNQLLATPHDYYMALAYTVRDRLKVIFIANFSVTLGGKEINLFNTRRSMRSCCPEICAC